MQICNIAEDNDDPGAATAATATRPIASHPDTFQGH